MPLSDVKKVKPEGFIGFSVIFGKTESKNYLSAKVESLITIDLN